MKKLLLFALIFLTACTTKLPQLTVTLPPPPTETPIPKPTFDPDFNQKTLFPGVDPQQFLGQTASEGRQITLPQDVFAYLRQHHLAPLQDSQGFVSRVSGDGVCSVMFPDHLVDSGAALKAIDVAGGQAVFAVNGTESVGQFRFQVPDGVSCVASVAQAGSGFAEGTVLVTLFQNDGKAGAEVLNEEPLKVIVDEPNKITFVFLENGFKLVTTDANGNVIEEQAVDIDIAVSEAVLQAQADFEKYGYSIDGLEWVEDENGVRAIDLATGAEIYNNGQWDVFAFRELGVEAKLFAPTKYAPLPAQLTNGVWNRLPGTPPDYMRSEYLFGVLADQFVEKYVEENGFDPTRDEDGNLRNGVAFLLDPAMRSWAFIKDVDFNDGKGVVKIMLFQRNDRSVDFVRLLSVSREEIVRFWKDQASQ